MSLPEIVGKTVSHGPIAVFLLFLLPINPAGATPGIVLARMDGVPPLVTVGLYILSDVVAAAILEPFVRRIRSAAERSDFGRLYLEQVRRLGALTDEGAGPIGLPMSLTAFGLIAGVLFGGIISVGLPIARVLAWTCVILGDTISFLILFVASLGIAPFLNDNRVYFVATLLLGFALPPLVRRILRRRQPVDQGRR